MNEKIDLTKILKDCPKGMELDCTMYEDVYFDYVDELNIIHCYIQYETHRTSLIFNQHGTPNSNIKSKCVIFPKGKTSWKGFQRHFKDGDIVISDKGDIHLLRTLDSSYCAYRERWEGISKFDSTITTDVKVVRLATEEEKQKLFNAIKEDGYRWNSETKTLEYLIVPKFKVGDRVRHKTTNKEDVYEISKVYDDSYGLVGFTWMIYMKYQDQYELVPNKFNTKNFKPFDKVLVRTHLDNNWCAAFFSHLNSPETLYYKFATTSGLSYKQCIPYNEETKHLLGTNNQAPEFYRY